MTEDDVRSLLRDQIKREAVSMSAWARQHEMTPMYVGDVLAGRRPVAGRVLGILGLRKVVTYEKENGLAD